MRFPFRRHTETQLGWGFVGKCFHKGVQNYHKPHTLHGWTLAGGQALGNNKCAGRKQFIFQWLEKVLNIFSKPWIIKGMAFPRFGN